MTCAKKTCVICFEKEAFVIIDDCCLCSDCANLSKDNFLLKCGGCGCATNISRNEHNIARVARIMLASQNTCISELHFNLMISAIRLEKPVIIPLNYCPYCIQKKQFTGAIKSVDQIPNVIF